MPWLYGIKTRHDMNGKMSPIIWKINFSRKVSIISGMRVKNCHKKKKKKNLKKKLNFQSSLPEVFVNNTVLEPLF